MVRKMAAAVMVAGLALGGGSEAFAKGAGGGGGKGGGGKSGGGSAGKGGGPAAGRGPSAPAAGGPKAGPSAPAKSAPQPNCGPGMHPTPQAAPRTAAQKAVDAVKQAPKSATPLGAVMSLLSPTKLGDATVCTPDKKK